MPITIKLHRVLAAGPEKVFRAFVEPDAVASWLPRERQAGGHGAGMW